jgi:DNA-binding response OmpR family regulator
MDLILVIEDDLRIQKVLHRLFTAEQYEVHIEGEGHAGLAACKRLRPVAVILDLMLPGLSGRELCREIKAWSAETPVIMLSAVSEVADKVLLLELGAEDYVTKPFSPRELLARVQGAIRRRRAHPASSEPVAPLIHSFADVTVDFERMEVQRAGSPVALTAHEFKLLKHFLDNAGRAVSREELLNEVWGFHAYPTTRTVDNQVMKLRQKLERDPAQPVHFLTLRGVGYKFVREA